MQLFEIEAQKVSGRRDGAGNRDAPLGGNLDGPAKDGEIAEDRAVLSKRDVASPDDHVARDSRIDPHVAENSHDPPRDGGGNGRIPAEDGHVGDRSDGGE